ncbi:unnamed protein product [Rotaria socialis]|nr:unnamed protein product [Rotaria socialis]CAF3408491.1 unnamed protein product [Rotaria socialis]CAF3420326.1 unnamed protein product [Rotaria socialis]CAF4503220.1 unnamed protein product [Rotaria socialis]CAF4648816.1 unnamed protein product [Rotaria socialis]
MGATRQHMCKRCSDRRDELAKRLNLSEKDGALIKLAFGDQCDACRRYIRADYYALTSGVARGVAIGQLPNG